jgi:hypothetical protein
MLNLSCTFSLIDVTSINHKKALPEVFFFFLILILQKQQFYVENTHTFYIENNMCFEFLLVKCFHKLTKIHCKENPIYVPKWDES